MALRATFAVEPGNFNCPPQELYYHKIASWGDFKGVLFRG